MSWGPKVAVACAQSFQLWRAETSRCRKTPRAERCSQFLKCWLVLPFIDQQIRTQFLRGSNVIAGAVRRHFSAKFASIMSAAIFTVGLHTLHRSTMYEFDILKQQGAFERQFTIERLVELSGASRRSIYGYVKAGVVDPPDRSGRQHIWTHWHLLQIAEVRRQTAAGSALSGISLSRLRGPERPFTKLVADVSVSSAQIQRSCHIQIAPGLVLNIHRKLTKGERAAVLDACSHLAKVLDQS